MAGYNHGNAPVMGESIISNSSSSRMEHQGLDNTNGFDTSDDPSDINAAFYKLVTSLSEKHTIDEKSSNPLLVAIDNHNKAKSSCQSSPKPGSSRSPSPAFNKSCLYSKYGSCRDGYIYYSLKEVELIQPTEEDFNRIAFEVKKALRDYMYPSRITKGINAWRGMTEKLDAGIIISSEDKFNYQTTSLLNKLSLVSFHALYKEFVKIDFGTAVNIEKFMNQLFKKAQSEEAYCYLYANMVQRSYKTYENKIIDGVSYKSFIIKLFKRLIDESLLRDEAEERAIKELKEFRTNDEDKLDEVINELEERENNYRKPKFGSLSFLAALLHLKCIDEEYVLEKLKNFKQATDAFGCQMLVFALQTFGDLVYYKDGFKELYDIVLEELGRIKSTFRFELKFAIIDTIKMKSDGFKSKAPRKIVPDSSDALISHSNTLINPPKSNIYNLDKKIPRSGRYNPGGRRERTTARNQRFTTTSNKFAPLTRKHIEKEPEQSREPRSVQFYRPATTPVVKEVESKKSDLVLNLYIPDLLMSEFDIDKVMLQLRDLLINKYALEFCKIGMKTILDYKQMHLSFGLLISRLVSTYSEFKQSIPEAIEHAIEELPTNAMDEPVLWVRFYRMMIPILESNCISLDNFSRILENHDEISSSIPIIGDLFSTCLKELSCYQLLTIRKHNRNSLVLKNVLDSKSEFKEIIEIPMGKSDFFWFGKFFNTSVENLQLDKEISQLYHSSSVISRDTALKDLARITYLNCLSGDDFNSTLVDVFVKRGKKFFESAFFESAGIKFCQYFCECLLRYNTKYELFSLLGVAVCKSGLVDVGFLNKCYSTTSHQAVEKLEPQISFILSKLKQ